MRHQTGALVAMYYLAQYWGDPLNPRFPLDDDGDGGGTVDPWGVPFDGSGVADPFDYLHLVLALS